MPWGRNVAGLWPGTGRDVSLEACPGRKPPTRYFWVGGSQYFSGRKRQHGGCSLSMKHSRLYCKPV